MVQLYKRKFQMIIKKAWIFRVQASVYAPGVTIYYCFPPSINISFTLISVTYRFSLAGVS